MTAASLRLPIPAQTHGVSLSHTEKRVCNNAGEDLHLTWEH